MGAVDEGLHRSVEVPAVDLIETLRFQRMGPFDPCGLFDARARRVAHAFRMQDGPVTLLLVQKGATTIEASAWGPSAARALDEVPAICGAADDPDAFATDHEGVQRLARRFRKMRSPRVPWTFESLLAIILQQRVAFVEAAQGWRKIALERGTDAPGPLGLRLFPAKSALLEMPTWAYRESLVDRKRELAIRALLDHEREITASLVLSFDEIRATLQHIPGIGPWTIESFLGQSRGDPDAVPTADYWIPHMVSYALTGKPRSNDEEMLALLERFRPHRGRVMRLLGAAGYSAPRHGPRKKSMLRGL
jgi:3-methyladenine DNA glycosylase/8-oxoguanine DNA glycosylase